VTFASGWVAGLLVRPTQRSGFDVVVSAPVREEI